jgi:hypothetical protein
MIAGAFKPRLQENAGQLIEDGRVPTRKLFAKLLLPNVGSAKHRRIVSGLPYQHHPDRQTC